jgi:hypothetical protein
MKHFRQGQRVRVLAHGEDERIVINPTALGTVSRLRRCDNGAFIRLDPPRRRDIRYLFPADVGEDRATSVLAYPDDCEEA